MLKSSHRKLAGGLAILLLAASCAHRVDVRPNTSVGSDIAQTLVLSNGTDAPLTVMPSISDSAKPSLFVQLNGKTSLPFTLRLEENVSPGRERQVILVPEKSSPYVTQSAIDLLMKVSFGHGKVREIRVRLGKCLFDSALTVRTHQLHFKKVPLVGVPMLQLCP